MTPALSESNLNRVLHLKHNWKRHRQPQRHFAQVQTEIFFQRILNNCNTNADCVHFKFRTIVGNYAICKIPKVVTRVNWTILGTPSTDHKFKQILLLNISSINVYAQT